MAGCSLGLAQEAPAQTQCHSRGPLQSSPSLTVKGLGAKNVLTESFAGAGAGAGVGAGAGAGLGAGVGGAWAGWGSGVGMGLDWAGNGVGWWEEFCDWLLIF